MLSEFFANNKVELKKFLAKLKTNNQYNYPFASKKD